MSRLGLGLRLARGAGAGVRGAGAEGRRGRGEGAERAAELARIAQRPPMRPAEARAFLGIPARRARQDPGVLAGRLQLQARGGRLKVCVT
jgi:hypothetical protein